MMNRSCMRTCYIIIYCTILRSPRAIRRTTTGVPLGKLLRRCRTLALAFALAPSTAILVNIIAITQNTHESKFGIIYGRVSS
jgi:hypothetical protein